MDPLMILTSTMLSMHINATFGPLESCVYLDFLPKVTQQGVYVRGAVLGSECQEDQMRSLIIAKSAALTAGKIPLTRSGYLVVLAGVRRILR